MKWFNNLRWKFKKSDIKARRDIFISEARKDYFDGYYVAPGDIFSGFNTLFKIFSGKNLINNDDYIFVSKKLPQIGAIVHFTSHLSLTYAWNVIKRVRDMKFSVKIPYVLVTEIYDSGFYSIITNAGGICVNFSSHDTPRGAFNDFNRKLRDNFEYK